MSFTKQIASIEELERSILLYETKLFNRLQHIKISEVEKYGGYWEQFVGKSIDPRTLQSPKEVKAKWNEIRTDKKTTWLDQLASYHNEKNESLGNYKSDRTP